MLCFPYRDKTFLSLYAKRICKLVFGKMGIGADKSAELLNILLGNRGRGCRKDEVYVRMDELVYLVALGTGTAGVLINMGLAVEVLQKSKADGKGFPSILFMEEYGMRDLPAVNHSGKSGNDFPVALYLRKFHIFLNALKRAICTR